jgi:hypothetical protein
MKAKNELEEAQRLEFLQEQQEEALIRQQEVEIARNELIAKEKEFKQRLEEQERKFKTEEKNIEMMK